MNLERLVEFVKIVECGGLTSAARQLHLSAATLSQRLSAFEASLNVTLFARTRGGLSLTPRGKHFYDDALHIVAHYTDMKARMTSSSPVSYEHIKIAISGTNIPLHLGPYLDMVNERFPGIVLDIMDDSRYDIENGLHSGDVDVYFGTIMSHVEFPDIRKQIIASPHQYAILPKSHPAAAKNAVSMQDLAGSSFILYPNATSPIRQFQIENIKASLIPHTLYESDSSPLFIHFLAPIGKGVLLTPSHSTEEMPRCVTLPVTDIAYPAPLSICFLKSQDNPDVKQFIDGFLQFAKESTRHDHRKAI